MSGAVDAPIIDAKIVPTTGTSSAPRSSSAFPQNVYVADIGRTLHQYTLWRFLGFADYGDSWVLLTASERIQYEGYLRREDTNAASFKQAETGVSIRRSCGSPDTVRASSAGCCEVSERCVEDAQEFSRTSPVLA
jgi:hypothetical protein